MLGQESGNPTGVRFQLARAGLALSLVATMGAALVTQGNAQAQQSALLTTSTVAPADAALYAEVKLDPENAELQELDELFVRLGSEESFIEAIEDSAEDATGGVDVTNAELAVVVLPSALESAAESEAPDLGDLSDPDSVAGEFSEAGAGVSDEGIGIIIRPNDIAQLEAEISEEAGADAESEEYLGSEIVTYTDDDGELNTYVVLGEYFVYVTSVDDAKLFVDASLDGGESLSAVEEFAAASDALPSERVAFAYANGDLFVDALAEVDDPTVAPFATDIFSTYRAHFGAILAAEANGITLESVMIPADGSTVEPRGSDEALTYASQMPADTVVFTSGHDLGETLVMRSLGLVLVAGFGSLTSSSFDDTEATPVPMTVDEMYESVGQFLGFNLKTGFLDQLTGPYAFGVWGVESQDPADIGAVLISGADDPEVLGDTIGSISFLVQAAGQGEVSVVSRTVGDASVNNVTFDVEGSAMSLDFGLVDDQFVLGLGDGVDTVLLGPDGALADSPKYIAALEHLPAEYEGVQYVDLATLAKVSESAGTGGMMGDVIPTPVAGSMDEVQPESYAAVTYVEDGYTHTSAIIVFP